MACSHGVQPAEEGCARDGVAVGHLLGRGCLPLRKAMKTHRTHLPGAAVREPQDENTVLPPAVLGLSCSSWEGNRCHLALCKDASTGLLRAR